MEEIFIPNGRDEAYNYGRTLLSRSVVPSIYFYGAVPKKPAFRSNADYDLVKLPYFPYCHFSLLPFLHYSRYLVYMSSVLKYPIPSSTSHDFVSHHLSFTNIIRHCRDQYHRR